MAAMCVQLQNGEQRGKLCFIRLRRSKPHVFFDRPPRQQPRLLKHHGDPCLCRTRNAALIVMVETGEDLQHGALAAAGWADERANLSCTERKVEISDHVEPFAGRVCERLACDTDLKLHGAATEIAESQTAAPGGFRWRAPPPRNSANRRAKERCRIAGRRRRFRSQRRLSVRAIRRPARSSRPEKERIARRQRYRAPVAAI